MIVGIGTDIVSARRIQAVQMQMGDRFAKRILTPDEFHLYEQRKRSYLYLASRFAAKEATAKALGTGIGKVSFRDIETQHTENGAPFIMLYRHAKILKNKLNIQNIHLSVSDEKEFVVAFVIMEGKN
ncbi:MAG: holo-ACP synthase [Endozoicomonadaceae bacterium]|nr:holo-ACP synthase [Endozoicomonadaceae bacterium]MCY4330102.1 holo-ACP synthase [Endozoicomonadaceae bacterium]